MTELELVFNHLEYASCPEDIFGLVPSAMSSVFKHLAKAVHPDYNTDKVLATKAFQLLTEINREGEKRIADKTYGKKILFDWCIPVSIGKYKVNKTPIKGSIADLYKVEMKDILVKVARSHDDNDLMQAEAEALTILLSNSS